jgi:hypothetical protein
MAKIASGGMYVYENADKHLYASYCDFSRGSNNNILGRSRFESLLLDVCVHQLGLGVSKQTTSRGSLICGVAVRKSSPTRYDGYPSIIDVGFNKKDWQENYGLNLEEHRSATIEVDYDVEF